MQNHLLLACALAALPLPLPQTPTQAPAQPAAKTQQASPQAATYPPGIPKELFDIDRVVDGDTIWVQYHGALTKLRLLCVDTEEKLSVNTGSDSKLGTVYGEACAKWAQEFFAASAKDEKKPQVGLYFPERRCHQGS